MGSANGRVGTENLGGRRRMIRKIASAYCLHLGEDDQYGRKKPKLCVLLHTRAEAAPEHNRRLSEGDVLGLSWRAGDPGRPLLLQAFRFRRRFLGIHAFVRPPLRARTGISWIRCSRAYSEFHQRFSGHGGGGGMVAPPKR